MKKAHTALAVAFFLNISLAAPIAVLAGGQARIGLRYALAAVILLRWFPTLRKGLPAAGTWALVLVAVAWASLAWTSSISTTALGALDLTIVTLAAMALGAGNRAEGLVRALAISGAIVLLISLVLIAAQPATRLDENGAAAWRGVFDNSNEFGRQLIVLIAVSGAMGLKQKRWFVVTALALVTSLQTASAQAVIIAVVALAMIAAGPFINASRKWRASAVVMVIGATAASTLLALSQRDSLLLILGKDLTLTNRVLIWDAISADLDGAWLLGYGYNSFWSGPSAHFITAEGSQAFQAHNSLLEAVLQIGVVGAVVLVTVVLSTLSVTLRALRHDRVAGTALLATTAVLVVYSATASVFLRTPEQIYWVTLVALVAAAHHVTGSRADVGKSVKLRTLRTRSTPRRSPTSRPQHDGGEDADRALPPAGRHPTPEHQFGHP